MMLTILLAIPLTTAVLSAVARRRLLIEAIHTIGALGMFAAGVTVIVGVWSSGRSAPPETAALLSFGGLLRVDALSAFLIAVITLMGTIAALYSLGYIRAEFDNSRLSRVRLFFGLFHFFLFSMLLAVSTDNLGVMWVAIEGTTLATVFLVNLHQTPTSLEAAYKYLILSSVGIALAFIGTVLMYYAGSAHAGEIAVNWTSLHAAASSLNPQVVRIAFAFILVGYGTKTGLAPMHTWLPDAHSEAPAPVSALMSGVLLNVGLYALIRFKEIVDIAAGPAFASRWLMGTGLLSLGVAAALLLAPRNYKRMLAYSSIEHMGIICLGLGFGGYWGTFGALLHVLNHAFSKSLLFLLSGNILLKYQTTDIRRVRGLLSGSPIVGGAFLAGTLALIGLPPFGVFISEFIILRAGFEQGPQWVAIAAIALLVIIFAGMLGSVNRMLYGVPPDKVKGVRVPRLALAPLAVNFAFLLILGLMMPAILAEALRQVLSILGV